MSAAGASPTTDAVRLDWTTLGAKEGKVAVVSLNRPQQANAFHGDMVTALAEHFATIVKTADCRAMVLQGVGRNFSAGADLN